MQTYSQSTPRENPQITAISQVLRDLKTIYARCDASSKRINRLTHLYRRLASQYQTSCVRNSSEKPGATSYCSEYSRCVIQIVRLYAQSKYSNPTMVNHFIHRYLKILF